MKTYCYISIRMFWFFLKLTKPNADKNVEQLKLSDTADGVCKNGADTVENSVAVSYNVKMHLPC